MEDRVKLWCGVSGVLSAGPFAMLLAVMQSCTEEYEVDGAGNLLRVTLDSDKKPPAKVRTSVPWSTLERFPTVRSQLVPGDALTDTRTITGMSNTTISWEMHRLEVFRGGTWLAVYRVGHIRFWTLVVFLSMAPILLWSIAALILVSASPRKARPPPA